MSETAVVERCGVLSDLPEHRCPHPAKYGARWENGDEQRLCVEHAAWVRGNSDDLTVMRSLDVPDA